MRSNSNHKGSHNRNGRQHALSTLQRSAQTVAIPKQSKERENNQGTKQDLRALRQQQTCLKNKRARTTPPAQYHHRHGPFVSKEFPTPHAPSTRLPSERNDAVESSCPVMLCSAHLAGQDLDDMRNDCGMNGNFGFYSLRRWLSTVIVGTSVNARWQYLL